MVDVVNKCGGLERAEAHSRSDRFLKYFADHGWNIAPYAILLLAIGLRVHGVEAAWINVDQTHMHGQGIVLLDNVIHGHWSALPVFTYNSSSGLFNPGLMEYVWAMVVAIDPSLEFGILINLMVNTAAVAILYALSRSIFGRSIAAFTALQMAINPWTIGIARGMWQPAQLEFSFVLVTWLIIEGMLRSRPRLVFIGFIAAAAIGWTYILAIGTMALAGLTAVILFRRALALPIMLGAAACIASVVLMLGLANAEGKLSHLSLAGISEANPQPAIARLGEAFFGASRGTPVRELLHVSSDFEFIQTWAAPGAILPSIAKILSDIGGAILAALAAYGLVSAIRAHAPAGVQHRIWVLVWVWLGTPVLFFGLMKLLVPGFQVQTYYLLMTAPMGYLVVALGLYSIARNWNARLVSVFTACALIVAVPYSIWNLNSAIDKAREEKYAGSLNLIDLQTANGLGRRWRSVGCEVMHRSQDINDTSWYASLWRRASPIREGTFHISEQALVWEVNSGQKNCLMLDQIIPGLAEAFQPFTLPNGFSAKMYTLTPEATSNQVSELSVNIGWDLQTLETPKQVTANEPITVTHVWRIKTLPIEPFADWYFVPNIKLVANDAGGSVLGEYWGTATEGRAWAIGDEIHSRIVIGPRPDLAGKDYRLRITLFDPNQKKNAVYFSSNAPTTPILELNRDVSIGFSR